MNIRQDTGQAIEEAVDLYSDMVYRLAYCHTGNRCDADDVYQEVFLRLVRNSKPFDSEEHRKAWLIRVCVNCCNDHFGKRKRQRELEEKAKQGLEMAQEILEERHEGLEMRKALEKLSFKYKSVLHLFYYEDMSTKDIAQTLGIGESTARARLTRARQKLKQLLAEEEVQL